ncbi:DNA mismatch repair protein MutL [Lichtheimia hyalospora FSU 10163]|nr:DNA mismatch repair protein MutL [Lichtheimia hyalospora FSU 10163]
MAVKELVENSLDAGATTIDIKFKDQGLDAIEVSDNGSGVHESNYASLALKHHTSKLQNFEDLARVNTFGFRGEALSSLTALGELVVTTATKDQAPRGTRLEYDADGKLVSRSAVARSMGTTVQINNLFHSLPVRQQEFKRHIKREYTKALSLLQAYALISQNTRLTVTNQTSRGQGSKLLATSGNKTIRENIVNVFGTKMISQVVPFCVEFTVEDDQPVKIQGFISKPVPGAGRNTADRQYMFVNGRPCSLPKISKAVNDAYKSIVPSQSPFLLADIQLSPAMYDVNITPDKRSLYLHDERQIIDELTEGITQELMTTSTVEIHSQQEITNSVTRRAGSFLLSQSNTAIEQERMTSPLENTMTRRVEETAISQSPSSVNDTVTSDNDPSTKGSWLTRLQSMAARNEKRTMGTRTKKRQSTLLAHITSKRPRTIHDNDDDEEETDTSTPESTPRSMLSERSTSVSTRDESMEIDELEEDGDSDKGQDESAHGDEPVTTTIANGAWCTGDIERSIPIHDEDHFVERLKKKYDIISSKSTSSNGSRYDNDSQRVFVKAANLENQDDTAAADALSRVIHKSDFSRMEVIGQFNDSFILVMLDGYDLFIVDQHASDEKYNFEDLQANTRIESQRLVVPHVPDLTVAEESVAIENAHILKANCFEFRVNQDGPPGKRIQVISQPMSDSKIFSSTDFSELIHSLTEHPGRMVKCRGLRNVYASRACRKSKMFGDPLKYKEMVQIIQHMGELDHPWNCPHGRPTLRHLHRFKRHRQDAPQRPITFKGSLFTHSP